MIDLVCKWWTGTRICAQLAKRTIQDKGFPAREVCVEHFTMWQKFNLTL